MLSTKSSIHYDYDKKNDILYCSFSDKSNSYGDEEPDNIIIMRDLVTDEITGITVMNIKRMLQENDIRIHIIQNYIDLEDFTTRMRI